MNKQEQRIAIAEACGWKLQSVGNKPYGTTPDGAACLNFLDYLNDLNAMHEVTSVLCDQTTQRFTDELIKVTKANTHGVAVIYSSLYDATAAQRAEAFLRTIGKWEDES